MIIRIIIAFAVEQLLLLMKKRRWTIWLASTQSVDRPGNQLSGFKPLIEELQS
jgi:hypothetical protein